MRVKYLLPFALFLFALPTTESFRRPRIRNKQTHQENDKKTFEQTTGVTTPAKVQKIQEEFYNFPEENSDSIRSLVNWIAEADESGGGSIPEEVEYDNGNPVDPKTNKKVIIYEEEMEYEKIILEANVTRVRNSNPRGQPDTHELSRLPCDKSYLEYYIYELITSGQLPREAVFPTWNEKPTLHEKISFLNRTLIKLNLNPLPTCDLLLLDLNLSSLQLCFKTQTTRATITSHERTTQNQKNEAQNDKYEKSTPASTKAAGSTPQPTLSAEERQKRKEMLINLINEGYLPQDTITKLKRGEIDVEWIQRNVSKNPKFIMSKLPDKIRELIVSGQLPKHIEKAILSGKDNNETAMKQLLFQDDKVIKLLLPASIVDMLQDRPVPEKLRQILMSNKNETEMKKAIVTDTELMQQLMSPSMYYFYTLFQVQRNKDINVALSVVLMVVLTCVMMSLGCTMTLAQIGQHARRPKGVIIALFAQFIIMPAAAFGLTRAFNLEVFAAMAVLICGCCPGGNLSNMLAYALNGDMNLSILMTTCSSIVGLGLMPLNIFIYSRFIVSVDSGQVVPFDKIVLNIAFTIIPVGIGIAIRHYKPTWVPNVMRVGAVVLGIGTVLVAVLSGVMFGGAFFIYFPVKVLACCAILPMAGYIFGYGFAWIARENPKCRRTICVETGCQNVQLCSTVLKLAFNPVVVGVLFLMPLVYMCFQVVEAVLIIFLFRLRNRCSGKKELVEEDSEVKQKSDIESSVDDKKSSENETKGLLDAPQQENKDDQGRTTENDKEAWPMEGKPADAIVDSFKAAGTEHLF